MMPINLYEAILTPSLLTADSYFGSISDSVGSWNMNPAAIILIICVTVLIGLLITASFVYNKFYRPPSSAGKEFTENKPGEIREILSTAQDQRSKIELGFRHENTQHTANCSLLGIKNNYLILEFPTYLNPTKQWIDREVSCYFKIVGKKQHIFYHFYSSIVDIDKSDPVVIKGTIALPDKLELTQRRNHYRLEVPPGFIQNFQVWRAQYTAQHALSPKPSSWGKALFSLDSQDSGQVKLQDISGGGLRLKLPRQVIKAQEFDPENDKNFLLQIALWEPAEQETNTYWIFAKSRNIFEDYTSRDVEIGFQFVGQGKPKEDNPQLLTWKKVDPNEGVEEITTWVFRRHVEIHRQEGALDNY